MEADRSHLARPSGRDAAALALVAALAVVSPSADAAAPAGEPPVVSKPAAPGGALAKRAAPTHVWHDGERERALVLEPALRADFSGSFPGKAVVLRAAPEGGVLKDVSPALQSAVLRDEAGRARALPGGVLVVMREGTGTSDAYALLARHGAADARAINGRTWLASAPSGLASLELANRLAATGAFAAAQPNWWVERALK